MTLPDERYRAVTGTYRFLMDLCDPKKTPRVPKDIRQQAYWCLRHYPSEFDMDRASAGAPQVFQKHMEPVYRMVKQYEQDKENERKS
jgi:hypothetical protein